MVLYYTGIYMIKKVLLSLLASYWLGMGFYLDYQTYTIINQPPDATLFILNHTVGPLIYPSMNFASIRLNMYMRLHH